MIKLNKIDSYLKNLLKPEQFPDIAYNGLQVEVCDDIETIGFAVDAGLSVLQQAVDNLCNMLITHHGIFWGQTYPIVDVMATKVKLLMTNNCSLYASHLPLDGNQQFGHGVELAKWLNLQSIEGFCEIASDTYVGAKGILPQGINRDLLIERLKTIPNSTTPTIFPFGVEEIKTIGIVTGSGTSAIESCVNDNIDLLISGEPKHEGYHMAKERFVNAVFVGHYATETYGLLALKKRIEEHFKVKTIFIEEPTGV